MNELLAFLEDYIACLQQIQSAEDAYDLLPSWQSANVGRWDEVRPHLNTALNLEGDRAFAQHVPTTFVGRLDGWVVVAANPGWSAVANGLEDAFRRTTAAHNAEFIRGFFQEYPTVTHRTNPTWSRVLRLYAQAHVEPQIPNLRGVRLWTHAHQEDWPIGGLDLIPFHSAKDGITSLLLEPPNPTAEMMRIVAIETLRLGVRLAAERLIVTSGPGLVLLEQVASAGHLGAHDVLNLPANETGCWFDARHYAFPGRGGRVVTLSRQVFSGNSRIPGGRTLTEVLPLLVGQPGA
jgi:hypothetical protein